MVGGDFNTIKTIEEKQGGQHPDRNSLLDFNTFINSNGLHDIGYTGSKFTWCSDNPREMIWERLNKVLGNSKALDSLNIKVLHGPRGISDHSPLICLNDEPRSWKSSFKYQTMWYTHPQCLDVIQETWNQHSNLPRLYKFYHKLRATKQALADWNTNTFGRINNRIATATSILQDLELKIQLRPNLPTGTARS